MRLLPTILASLLITAAPPAWAGPSAEALGNCLTENSTGKERKELARWLFTAMSAHPAILDLSKVSAADREESARFSGTLFTRLLTESCAPQARAAVKAEGSLAMQVAFSKLGQAAMQELMSNPEVGAAMALVERHMDAAKLQSALAMP